MATLAAAEGYEVGPVLSRTRTAARKAVREMRLGRPAASSAAFADTDIVLITAPDREIEGIARRLAAAPFDWKRKSVLTTSAQCSFLWSEPLRERGAAAGCLFPLQAFQRPLTSLAGVYFVLSGDTQAVREARTLTQAFGATFALSGEGGNSQAALGAVVASDVVTALFELAVRRFVQAGVRRKRAVEALRVLVERSLADYQRSGVRSRPGPLLQGDADAVHRRLAAIAVGEPDEAERHQRAFELSLDILEIDDPEFAFLGDASSRAACAGGR